MKPFGHASSSYGWGYNLDLLVGHLEDLVASECDATGKRAKLVERAEKTLNELQDIQAEFNESD